MKRNYLIVIDMQHDFISGSLGTPEAQAIVPAVVEKIKNWDGAVKFTKDFHSAIYLKTQEGRMLPVEHCIAGTFGCWICDEITPYIEPGSVYNKETFGCVELAGDLKEAYYKGRLGEITLVGLCTDICVISNALLLKTMLPEVKITVDASCCAGVTKASHDVALAAMRMCQINVVGEGEEPWRK